MRGDFLIIELLFTVLVFIGVFFFFLCGFMLYCFCIFFTLCVKCAELWPTTVVYKLYE